MKFGKAVAVALGAAILFPGCDVINSAKNSKAVSEAAMKGRNLFVGISQAGIEREACGQPSVWPVTEDNINTDDETGVTGRTFSNSWEYFRQLLDLDHVGTDRHNPLVTDIGPELLRFDGSGDRSNWIVAMNVKDDWQDIVPVMISSNVDPSMLRTSWDGTGDRQIPFGSEVGRTPFPWADFAVVVVTKGGGVKVLKRKFFKDSCLYDRCVFDAPGLRYLDAE